MAVSLYLATTIGLFIATQSNGNWTVSGQALNGEPLTSVAVSEGVLLAGSAEGIWRSTDHGKTWKKTNGGLSIPYVRWMAAESRTPALILAGTEPAGIFVSSDAGNTWTTDPEIVRLRDVNGWFLPYSPRAGCVRGFAFAGSGPDDGRIYAAVEVGGVLISDDHGRSWQLAAGSDGKPDFNRELGALVHPDVHAITVHPSAPEVVTAATGGGLFRSADSGKSWKNIYPGYIRAVWVDPGDHRHIVAGPADGVSRNGRIEASRDGGKSWHPAADGMKPPWPRHMVERFFQVHDELFAILSNGDLWSRKPGGSKWDRVLPEIRGIKAMAANN
jgi:photosystem II stability/assembly factor-like uncharacterized protein